MKTVQILGLSIQFSFLFRLQVLLNEKFFDSQSVYLLDVLLKHLGHWVASALKQMHQVHDLLLAQFKISHLVLQSLTHLFQFVILSDESVHVFNKLSILFLQLANDLLIQVLLFELNWRNLLRFKLFEG